MMRFDKDMLSNVVTTYSQISSSYLTKLDENIYIYIYDPILIGTYDEIRGECMTTSDLKYMIKLQMCQFMLIMYFIQI